MSNMLVRTESGACYLIEGTRVMGGSKDLHNGKLIFPVQLGDSMLIATPERAHLNPTFEYPCVMSSKVVEIVPINSKSKFRRIKTQMSIQD